MSKQNDQAANPSEKEEAGAANEKEERGPEKSFISEPNDQSALAKNGGNEKNAGLINEPKIQANSNGFAG